MKNLVSGLFVEAKNLVDSDYRFGLLERLYGSRNPTAPGQLAAMYSKNQYLSRESHCRSCLEEMLPYKLTSKSPGGRYEMGPVGSFLIRSMRKRDADFLRNLRPIKRRNGYSQCTEEKILLSLSDGPKNISYISSAIGAVRRTTDDGLRNLRDSRLVRRHSQRTRYFRLERELGAAEVERLDRYERPVYDRLLGREYVSGANLIRDMGTGAYSVGTSRLISTGVVSDKRNELLYALTPRGKTGSSLLLKMNEMLGADNDGAGRSVRGSNTRREEISLGEAFRRVASKNTLSGDTN